MLGNKNKKLSYFNIDAINIGRTTNTRTSYINWHYFRYLNNIKYATISRTKQYDVYDVYTNCSY